MKIKALIIIGIMSISMTACSKGEEDKEEVIINMFDKDVNTLRDKYSYNNNKKTNIETDNTEKETETEEFVYKEPSIGEITMSGKMDKVKYKVNGDDIEYNGVTYIGLNLYLDNLECKYTKDEMIKFIVSTYKTSTSKVNIIYQNDNELDSNSNALRVHDSLIGFNNYDIVYNKYKEEASWQLTLLDSNFSNKAILFGCKSYLIYNGDDDIEFDLGV